jgi:hypothetical protein
MYVKKCEANVVFDGDLATFVGGPLEAGHDETGGDFAWPVITSVKRAMKK